MTTGHAFEVLDFLPCDRIVREDSGKFVIVGAYSGGVVPHAPLPLACQFWYWVRVVRRTKEKSSFKLELLSPEKTVVYSAAGEYEDTQKDTVVRPSVLPIGTDSPTLLASYGTYVAFLTLDGERREVGTFLVESNRSPDSLVPGTRYPGR